MASVGFTQSQISSLETLERVGATLSLLGVCSIFVTYAVFKRLRTVPNTFILFASVANVGASVACLIGFDGVRQGQHSWLCQFQAFLLEMFMQSDSWWSLAMAVNVFMVFFFAANPNAFRKHLWVYCIICFGGPGVPALVCLLVRDPQKGRVYGDATLWCWIDGEWSTLRIYTYYLFIWICIVTSAIIYVAVGYHVFHQRNQLRNLTLSHQGKEVTTTDGGESSAENKTPPLPPSNVYGTVTTDIEVTSAAMSPGELEQARRQSPRFATTTATYHSSDPVAGWPLSARGLGGVLGADLLDADLESGADSILKCTDDEDRTDDEDIRAPPPPPTPGASRAQQPWPPQPGQQPSLATPASAVPMGFPHQGQAFCGVAQVKCSAAPRKPSAAGSDATTLPARVLAAAFRRGSASTARAAEKRASTSQGGGGGGDAVRASARSERMSTTTTLAPPALLQGGGVFSAADSSLPTTPPQALPPPRRPSLPRRAISRVASLYRNMDPVKLAYLRTSFVFAVSVLVTWTPSSINRVWSLAHPAPPRGGAPHTGSSTTTGGGGNADVATAVAGALLLAARNATAADASSSSSNDAAADDAARQAWLRTAFALSAASAAVLPLQGLWNAVIYFSTSWGAVRAELTTAVERHRRRKETRRRERERERRRAAGGGGGDESPGATAGAPRRFWWGREGSGEALALERTRSPSDALTAGFEVGGTCGVGGGGGGVVGAVDDAVPTGLRRSFAVPPADARILDLQRGTPILGGNVRVARDGSLGSF